MQSITTRSHPLLRDRSQQYGPEIETNPEISANTLYPSFKATTLLLDSIREYWRIMEPDFPCRKFDLCSNGLYSFAVSESGQGDGLFEKGGFAFKNAELSASSSTTRPTQPFPESTQRLLFLPMSSNTGTLLSHFFRVRHLNSLGSCR